MKKNTKLKIEKKGFTVVWNLNAQCRRVVEPIAAEFGMTLEQFLKRHSANSLPAQITPQDEYKFKKRTSAQFACDDQGLMSRIQRAATFRETSLSEYIMEAIVSFVNCDEEEMIISPKTGEPFVEDEVIHQFRCFESREEKAA